MNIQRAKQEIINAIRAYLEKDEAGEYRISPVRQRPVLLMGPPGIGKTQIMEQIAGQMDLALAAYTITHHTRQSAIGLPFITKKCYGGQERSVTEYTMSEIIASMYEKMEGSGKKEGILFIDEINCVSETLAPAMLQFLQGKSFGNQKIPEGWIIVAAGNPPEYNRSVRDFDVVTMDRVKMIHIEPDFSVWKTYAYEAGIHGSVISYLDIHKENFYRMETTVDGQRFVTARGWEDLSEMIYAWERLGLAMDQEVIVQYLQHPGVAKDFASYLTLYYRYRDDYSVDEILSGKIRPGTLNKLKFAPFDEHLEVIGLLLARLSELFTVVRHTDELTDDLYEVLQQAKSSLESAEQPSCTLAAQLLKEILHAREAQEQERIAAGQNARMVRGRSVPLMREIEACLMALDREAHSESDAGPMAVLRMQMSQAVQVQEQCSGEAGAALEAAFDFMEAAFGESQEMVVFITQLSDSPDAVRFLQMYDCDRYYMYNKQLLFEDHAAAVRAQLDQIRQMQNT